MANERILNYESAKLLTYCHCILCDILNNKGTILEIKKEIDDKIALYETELSDIKSENNDLDKDLIHKMDTYISYLKKCSAELEKILKVQ